MSIVGRSGTGSSESKNRFLLSRRRIPTRILTSFTRETGILLRAGLPLVRTLEVLARQMRESAFREVVVMLADSIRAGRSLSDGMARHPEVFDRLYLNMIRAGEAAGELALIFERLASYRERSARLKARVQAAMVYPAIVTVISVAIVWLLLGVRCRFRPSCCSSWPSWPVSTRSLPWAWFS
jgi:type IV pilus assembly protein PilC